MKAELDKLLCPPLVFRDLGFTLEEFELYYKNTEGDLLRQRGYLYGLNVSLRRMFGNRIKDIRHFLENRNFNIESPKDRILRGNIRAVIRAIGRLLHSREG